MPAIAPIPPWALKQILELYGYKVTYEDQFNWLLEDPSQKDAEPIPLPKLGELVAVEIMMQAVLGSKMGLPTYFILKEKVLGPKWGYQAAAATAGNDPPKH